MTPEIFKYLCLGSYVLLTFWLSWIGMRKTQDIKGFSIGNKDMNPYLVGITMAASISSTATFVINPGFVYVHGLSAFLHYAVAGSLGLITAFLVLTRKFRSLGDAAGAITIPDWIYKRYQSRSLSLLFALINLLSITFVVLILVGCSLLMSQLFPISQSVSLTLILLFVFSYVLMGGTYAHAYTNTFQGLMMIGVALFLFISGIKYFEGGFFTAISSLGKQYSSWANADSNLYYDFFSVFVSGFLVTFALTLQPHILTKLLYLKSDKDVNKFIGTTVVVGLCFMLMLMIGFYARLKGLQIDSQDAVVSTYIAIEFSDTLWGQYFLTFVAITLLAAGMSTLDGILVALSAMVVKDIYQPLSGGSEFHHGRGLLLSRVVLVLVGIIAYIVAYNPPPLVGLFAQQGVYGLASASMIPILFGTVLKNRPATWIAWGAAGLGLVSYACLNLIVGIPNPAISAAYSIILSAMFAVIALLAQRILFLNQPPAAVVRQEESATTMIRK